MRFGLTRQIWHLLRYRYCNWYACSVEIVTDLRVIYYGRGQEKS